MARIGSMCWSKRFVLGEGGFIGEVTLQTIPPDCEYAMFVRMHGPRCVALTNMFVHPLRRGKGWADRLLNTATKYADRNGLTLLLWAVPYGKVKGAPTEALVKLYAKHGFEQLDGTTDMLRMPCPLN